MSFPFTIKRRIWSSLPPITLELDAKYENAPEGVKLGIALKILVGKAATEGTRAVLTDAVLTGAVLTRADLTRAVLTRAVLTRADLTRAVLTRAVLTDAVLTRAVLTRAVLTGAVLTDADPRGLRGIKADFFLILLANKAEVPGLIAALREGRVNGASYTGECACLVGTIANVRGVDVDDLEQDSGRPAERWFMGIRKGDTPETNQMAKMAEGWALEFCGLAGITSEVKAPESA